MEQTGLLGNLGTVETNVNVQLDTNTLLKLGLTITLCIMAFFLMKKAFA